MDVLERRIMSEGPQNITVAKSSKLYRESFNINGPNNRMNSFGLGYQTLDRQILRGLESET